MFGNEGEPESSEGEEFTRGGGESVLGKGRISDVEEN